MSTILNDPYANIDQSITITFPPHFKYPEDSKKYVIDWIPKLTKHLNRCIGIDNIVGIEIGSLYGGSSVFFLENILTGKNTTLYCIDTNTNEFLQNNLSVYPNAKFLQGLSGDILKTLTHNGSTKEFADFVYVDGSHIAFHVLEDAVFSWRLLKNNGIMIFDDYGWGFGAGEPNPAEITKTGVDAFLHGYKGLYNLIEGGWQVYLQKSVNIKTKYFTSSTS